MSARFKRRMFKTVVGVAYLLLTSYLGSWALELWRLTEGKNLKILFDENPVGVVLFYAVIILWAAISFFMLEFRKALIVCEVKARKKMRASY